MTLTKTAAFLVFISLLAFFPCGAGHTQATGPRPEKLTVVYTQWHPYTYREGDTAKGFEIDIFRAVMNRMGVKAELQQFPFKRCMKMLEDGNAQALISILKTKQRERFTVFPEEHISISRTLFFTKTGSDIQYGGSLKSLQRYTIGVIAGFSYGKAFDNASYLKKEEVVDAERLINMVIGGRYDLGVENQAVVRGTARKLGVERSIRFLSPPVHTRKLFVGFSRASGLQKFASQFSAALAQFKTTDEYKAILQRYGIAHSDMSQ